MLSAIILTFIAALLVLIENGQSLIEMSDRFDSPIGTIKRRLHTARNRLKDELNQVLQPA